MNDKLTEINGKFYQTCYPVLLSANEKTKIFRCHNDYLQYSENTSKGFVQSYIENLHLYILSDEEIKDSDFVYNNGEIGRISGVSKNKRHSKDCAIVIQNEKFSKTGFLKDCKKVISCTDKSLKIEVGDSGWKSASSEGWNEYKPEYKELPRPSNDFIEAYVKAQGKGFEKVLVQMRFLGGTGSGYVTKLASDNTITIIPFQKKDIPVLTEGTVKHQKKAYTIGIKNTQSPPSPKPVKSIAREMVRKVFLNLNSEQFNEIKMSEEYGINKGKAIDNWFDKNY